MASVVVKHAEPVAPPVESYTITLNPREAEIVTALVGVAIGAYQIYDIYNALVDAGVNRKACEMSRRAASEDDTCIRIGFKEVS